MGINKQIADLLVEHRRLKVAARVVRTEMVRIAVAHLGVDQQDAMQMNLEPLLDGYLIGQGVVQEWRKTKGAA